MNKNWEIVWNNLEKYQKINVTITPTYFIEQSLTSTELKRLEFKLDLLNKWATRMGENMIKGTIKYKDAEIPEKEWIRHIQDELIDILNYKLLLEESKKI